MRGATKLFLVLALLASAARAQDNPIKLKQPLTMGDVVKATFDDGKPLGHRTVLWSCDAFVGLDATKPKGGNVCVFPPMGGEYHLTALVADVPTEKRTFTDPADPSKKIEVEVVVGDPTTQSFTLTWNIADRKAPLPDKPLSELVKPEVAAKLAELYPQMAALLAKGLFANTAGEFRLAHANAIAQLGAGDLAEATAIINRRIAGVIPADDKETLSANVRTALAELLVKIGSEFGTPPQPGPGPEPGPTPTPGPTPNPTPIPDDAFGNVGRTVSAIAASMQPADRARSKSVADAYRGVARGLGSGDIPSINMAQTKLQTDVSVAEAGHESAWNPVNAAVIDAWNKTWTATPIDKRGAIDFDNAVATGLEAVPQ